MGVAHNAGEPIAGRCLKYEACGCVFCAVLLGLCQLSAIFCLHLVFLMGYIHIFLKLFMNTSNALKQICAFKTSIKEEMTVWYMKVHTWRNDFLFYCNSVAQAPGGVVGSHFAEALTSAFLRFAAAHMVDYYHFMVIVISNLVENDS